MNEIFNRSSDETKTELSSLNDAHIQNEALRDTFVSLGHTALFASSISFVSSAIPPGGAILLPLIIIAWLLSVIGLIAMTISFGAARRYIDARREALKEETPPRDICTNVLNTVALWTFPCSLIMIFIFVSANVLMSDA